MRLKILAERLLEDPVEVSANPSTRERKKFTSGTTVPTISNIKLRC
nr:ATP-dependent RNA helicase SrmB [Salmonella sp. NCTC 7297]